MPLDRILLSWDLSSLNPLVRAIAKPGTLNSSLGSEVIKDQEKTVGKTSLCRTLAARPRLSDS